MNNQRKFYELFKAYLLVCKRHVAQYPGLFSMSKMDVEHCVVSAGKQFRFRTVKKADYSSLASVGLMGNKNTNEYRQLVSFLVSHPVIGKRVESKAHADFGAPNASAAVFVGRLLREYLRRNKSYNCNRRIALSLYRAVVRYCSSNVFEARVTCYLENVGIVGGPFRINDRIKMKSLSPNDISKLYNTDECFRRFYSGPWTRNNRLRNVKAYVQIRLFSKIVYGDEGPPTKRYDPRVVGAREINSVLTAFALHVLGDVETSPLVVEVLDSAFNSDVRPFGENGYRSSSKTFADIHPQQYRAIRRTYENVVKFRATERDPDLLLWRLWTIAGRHSIEDRVLDMCIATETLVKTYLAVKTGSRLSSKDMAIYIAHLLGKTKQERERAYNIVRKGFWLRNAVVHGERMKADSLATIDDFSWLLRLAVRKTIEEGSVKAKKAVEDLVL